jgi:hypothetical protein
VTMKRSTPQAAARRPDTIVVYTTSSLATRHVIEYLRSCRQPAPQSASSTSSTSTTTTAIQSNWFQAAAPAGTRDTGMPGIGVAQHPQDSNSFGAKLCDAVAEAIDFSTRNFGALGNMTKSQFACIALGMMAYHGLDPAQPWNLGNQSPSIRA